MNAAVPDALTVLFIDDDSEFAGAITVALEATGYRVRCASDGQQGVQMARQERPDAILLDWMMPIKDGFEACKELRAIPALRDVPILALTAFGESIGEVYGLRAEGRQCLIQDCLEKPVEINVLLHRLAQAIHRPAPIA